MIFKKTKKNNNIYVHKYSTKKQSKISFSFLRGIIFYIYIYNSTITN